MRIRIDCLAPLVLTWASLGAGRVAGQPTPARWTVDARPIVTLGGDDPAALLQSVTGATRLPDGTVMVGDRGDFALRIFSPGGAVLKSFARLGSGPGEVRYLARMFRCGDSVYAYDIAEGNRVSVFTISGQYVRTFRFGSPRGEATPYESACNRNGDFVHLGWERRADMKGGAFRSVVVVWTSRPDSVTGRIIDSIPGSERWGLIRDNQLRGTRPLPLGKQPVLGISRSRVFLGSADRFQIRVDDHAGEQVGTLQRADAPLAVTPADVRNALQIEIANAGEPFRKRLEDAFAEMTFPKTLPAYTKLIVDANENVWVRPYPRGTPTSVRWSVFDANGTLAAEVEVPILLEVYEIGAEYLLGRYLDPREATPQVRLYRLNRTMR